MFSPATWGWGEGAGGEGTEQTPGLGLMRALFEPNWPALRGMGRESLKPRFHAISCRAALGAAQVWCVECHH